VLIWARASLIGGATYAAHRCERSLNEPNHLTDRNLAGRQGKRVASFFASNACDVSTFFKAPKNLLEKRRRDVLALSELRQRHGSMLLALGDRKPYQRPKRIFTPLG
jgi:hypothetical protein